MIVLKDKANLTGYNDCIFVHTFDYKRDITTSVFVGTVKLDTGSTIAFTINIDNTYLVISLTKEQVNTIYNTDKIATYTIKENDLPSITGSLTIKPF